MTAALARTYFALQGGLVCLWWALLMVWPASRAAFLPSRWPGDVLLSFAGPDLLLLGGASLGVACARHDLRRPLAWITVGACAYAALYCLNATLLTGEAWLAPALMLPSAVVTVVVARWV